MHPAHHYGHTLTLFWHCRGSISGRTTPTYLLHLQARHQCFHCSILMHSYLPGPLNHMVDDSLHHWNLSDAELLTHFNCSYPQPMPWQIYYPPSAMLSAVTSMLRRTWLLPELFLGMPLPPTAYGNAGRCQTLSLDPTLMALLDPITILQAYAHHYCTGQLTPSGLPVSS